MPETAIDEHGQMLSREDDVRTHAHGTRIEPHVLSETKASSMQG
jgi:hypothetical protein